MEDTILNLLHSRDESSIRQMENHYGPYCSRIARNILEDPEDVEEIISDTWLRAWNSIPPAKPDNLKLYLGRITRNLAFDRFRSQARKKRGGGETALVLEELYQCVASDANPEQEFERKQLAQVINRFVKTLPGNEQKVFLCRYWYMDSIRSISQRFGYSESKVKSMLFRTREKLREVLRKEGY